ncbi:hypothetical protein ACSNOK_24575 [Streptomyces sp. URMC 126]|uniref:hypothetical protein n=1 Tax=Streptomyces sp. URMC 126 TaxID=3423401 RepID=UPI003F1DBC24
MTRSLPHRLRAAAIVLAAAGALTAMGTLTASADEHISSTASAGYGWDAKSGDVPQGEHSESTGA